MPVPTRRAPQDPVGVSLLGAALATKKAATRRSAGKKRDVSMYLDSDAHVLRDGDDGKKVNHVIKGGQLVDDTDLTDDEIDELTALRAIRPATVEEIERLEAKEATDARAEVERTQREELEQLRASHAAERAEQEGKGATAEKLAALDDKHATAVSKLQEKHAAALAKLDAQ